jgi:hypothetical protein
MGKQRRVHALLRSVPRLRTSTSLRCLHAGDDARSYISNLCHSTHVSCDQVSCISVQLTRVVRSFRKSCNDLIESRRAIRNLNTMYPDLSADQLAQVMDITCIICREDMQAQQSIKRLHCQHVFHKHCLRSWFQRQQTCTSSLTVIIE